MLDSHIIQVCYCINTVIHLYLYLLKQERKSAEMSWNLDAAAPIYQQIKDKIKNDIISGKYLPGQKLPGVRDLATEASVNPNTMQRALADLEREGFIITLGTNGRVVTSDLALIEKEKDLQLRGITEAYLTRIKSLGFTKNDAADLILHLEEEN